MYLNVNTSDRHIKRLQVVKSLNARKQAWVSFVKIQLLLFVALILSVCSISYKYRSDIFLVSCSLVR